MAKEKIKINKKFETLKGLSELIKELGNDESDLIKFYSIKNELNKISIKKITKKGITKKEKDVLKKIWDFKILDAIKIRPVDFNMFIKDYDEEWHNSLKIETNNKIMMYELSKSLIPKLNFIKYRYHKHSVEKASKMVEISKQTGYNWQKQWNTEGVEGLHPKTRRGPKNRLNKEQLNKLNDYIEQNNNISTEDVKKYIINEFAKEYSDKQIRIIIRKLKYNEKQFYQ